jgi:CO/xanthine dehydrogenase Mo-binding subunit
VILQPDGSAVVRVGLTEMGQGLFTAVQTIAAQALGIAPEAVEVCPPDTSTVADSGPTVASRGALVSGHAVLDAVRRLRRRLDPVAAEILGCTPAEVDLADGHAQVAGDHTRRVTLAHVASEMAVRRLETIATGWYRSRPRTFDPETGQGGAYDFYAVACHVARAAVDPELGLVRVERVAAVHDVGRVLHRAALEGQVQGGVVQGMGWALSERLALRDGRLENPSFTDYVIPTASDAPAVVIDAIESDGAKGPYGSKGIGEPSFIPTAAAVRNAVCCALGVEINELPLTPPVIVRALGSRHPFAWVVGPAPPGDEGGAGSSSRPSMFMKGSGPSKP